MVYFISYSPIMRTLMDQSCSVRCRALWVAQKFNEAAYQMMKGLQGVVNELKVFLAHRLDPSGRREGWGGKH